jgi:hypothetical protein
MKKITLISMILSLILSLGIAFAAPTTLYVHPSSVTSTGEFTIYIKVSDVTNLYGYEFKLGYDTVILDAINVGIGSFLNGPTYPVVQEINDPAGYVWVGVTSLNPAAPKSGSGTLATITFQVTGSGSCALNLYDTTLGDYDANPIGHVVNDGYFSSTESTCLGDLDGNGMINIFDVGISSAAFGSYCYENTCPSGYSCWDDYSKCNFDSRWDPVADIFSSIIGEGGKDGLINIFDVATVASRFGLYC